MAGHPTGLWLEELAAPYYVFSEAGWEITIASPAGGPIPIDQGSVSGDFFTAESKKFMTDPVAIGKLGHTVKLSDVNASEFDCVFTAGGHGTVADFINCEPLQKIVETLYAADKFVASVCHGPVCLINCKKPSGEPLIKGHKCTIFTNTEEDMVQLTSTVVGLTGFKVEDKFKELGGVYESGDPWTSKCVADGKLITGQNPQSSEAVAKALVAALK
jgi:putative intracellular protease/amidase